MAMVKITSIHDDGSEGVSFDLAVDSDEDADELAEEIADGVEAAEGDED